LQRTIKAVVRPGEQSGWVAECFEMVIVTQGTTLDELMANLKQAVDPALEGEDPASLGLAPSS
jgi:predicted RNase H-like HicB family nuclease